MDSIIHLRAAQFHCLGGDIEDLIYDRDLSNLAWFYILLDTEQGQHQVSGKISSEHISDILFCVYSKILLWFPEITEENLEDLSKRLIKEASEYAR